MALRRKLALLAWLVLVPLVVTVSTTPRAAEAQIRCDADGDGVNDGTRTEWTTNGDDTVAETLLDEAGRSYSDSRAGYRWEIPVCYETETDGSLSVRVVGSAVEVEAAAARSWEYSALLEAMGDLGAAYLPPTPRIAPEIGENQVVGLETWLAIDGAAWAPVSATGVEGEVTVSATATPVATVWVFSDGEVRCAGPGVLYTPGAAGPAPCGREWEHTTRVAPMTMEVRIEYEVAWTSTLAGSGTVVDRGSSPGRWDLTVGEIQSVGTVGERDRPANPGLGADPDIARPNCSLVALVSGPCSGPVQDPDWPEWPGQDGDDEGCEWEKVVLRPWEIRWGDVADCTVVIIDWAAEAAKWLGAQALEVYNALPGPHKAVIENILSLLEGCAEFGIDAVAGLWSAFEQAASALQNPVAYVQEQWAMINELRLAIAEDPAGFAREFLGDVIDEDLLREDPAKWIGKIGCEIAFGVLTGGAGAATGRVATILRKIDDIKLWRDKKRDGNDGDRDRDDPDRDPDRDPDGPIVCSTNSFPTGTPVLMADGSHRAIELVAPGDRVLAYNLAEQEWGPRTVLAQWSHLDDGVMATATLTDGSAITATDHHRFWVDSEGRWRELDDVRPGDTLLTPEGVTTVADISVAKPDTARVWELDTAIDDNFAVSTGTTDVLVHNGSICDAGNVDEFRTALTDDVHEGAAGLIELNRLHRRRRELQQRVDDGETLSAAELTELRELRGRNDLVSNGTLRDQAALSRSGSLEHGIVSEQFSNIKLRLTSVDGATYDGNSDTLTITNVDSYMDQVSTLYSDAGNDLNPLTERLIREHVSNPANVPLDGFAGPPGLHAEIRAFNDLVNQMDAAGIDYDLADIQISTVKLADRSGADFPACSNCTGILPDEVGVPTGRRGDD